MNSDLKNKELIVPGIKALIRRAFYIELFYILFLYKKNLKLSILKDLLYTISTGMLIKRKIEEIVEKEKIAPKSLILYSYWMDKAAFAISETRIKCKKISRAHSFDIYEYRNKDNYLPLKKYICNHLNGIYFISEQGKEYFRNTYKIHDERRTKLSRLGVLNENQFRNRSANKSEFILVSCSAMIPLKGIEKIIEAISRINEIPINWIHIGENPCLNEYEKELKRIASDKTENKENIKYEFKGGLSNRELLNFYQNNQIDLFINTSLIEGLPVTIMEAMSFGIPVIAPDTGGIKEIVNSRNGVLLPTNSNWEEIKKAIEKIYNLEEKEYQKLRENAYKTWKEIYNAEKNYENFANDITVGDNSY